MGLKPVLIDFGNPGCEETNGLYQRVLQEQTLSLKKWYILLRDTFKCMLGKFAQCNFLMQSLSRKRTVFQPSLRISLEHLDCALYIIIREFSNKIFMLGNFQFFS